MQIYNKPWLMNREALADICTKYEANIKKIKALNLQEKFADMDNPVLEIRDNIAIIKIHGPLEKRLSWFGLFFGGTSTDLVKNKLIKAMNNDKVKKAILDIDTPGGEVDGTLELANLIFSFGKKKPIIALINEMAASAGFWLAAAGTKRVLNSQTAQVGSVGVVVEHHDISKRDEKFGVKITEIVSNPSRFKRIASPHTSLTAEGEKELQRVVDEIYSIKVTSIGGFLGISPENVIKNFGDGRMYRGSEAISRGMVHSVESFESLFSRLSNRKIKIFAKDKPMEFSIHDINENFLAKNCPNVLASIGQNAIDSFEITEKVLEQKAPSVLEKIKKDSYESGFAKGVSTECERIKGIEDMTPKGFKSFSEKYKFDSKTSKEQYACHILKEQKENRHVDLETIEGEATEAGLPPKGGKGGGSAENEKEQISDFVKAAKEGLSIVGSEDQPSYYNTANSKDTWIN